MRGKYNNALSNAWKQLNNEQKKHVNDTINQQQRSGADPGDLKKWQRDGPLNFGSLQMTNYINSSYIRFGGPGGGVVGP